MANETLASIVPLLIVAVPVLITSAVAPWLMARAASSAKAREKEQDAKIRHEERQEDWARLDAVAARQAQAAQKAEEAARKAEETAKKADDATKVLTKNVSAVHILVNNNLTLATKDTLKSKTRSLMLLRENIALKMSSGQAATHEEEAEVALLSGEIKSLEEVLVDREKQAAIVEAQHS